MMLFFPREDTLGRNIRTIEPDLKVAVVAAGAARAAHIADELALLDALARVDGQDRQCAYTEVYPLPWLMMTE